LTATAAAHPQAKDTFMKRNLIIGAVSALLIATGGVALARQSASAENDAVVDLAKAKVSLAQAVTTAEAQVNGRASKAELDGEGSAIVYKVEVVTADSKVFDMTIDAVDGKVLASQPDATDGKDEDADGDND
jgi:uncharacterized membrane protein YkoI